MSDLKMAAVLFMGWHSSTGCPLNLFKGRRPPLYANPQTIGNRIIKWAGYK
jgi:hypothetical protein